MKRGRGGARATRVLDKAAIQDRCAGEGFPCQKGKKTENSGLNRDKIVFAAPCSATRLFGAGFAKKKAGSESMRRQRILGGEQKSEKDW